jgi:hypothetical protein
MANTKDFPLERLDVETMASGNPALRLTEQVTWQEFPGYAARVISCLGGAVVDRADSPVERVWTATIQGAAFWVAFDDFALGVSLSPQDAAAARLIPNIRDTLLALRDQE